MPIIWIIYFCLSAFAGRLHLIFTLKGPIFEFSQVLHCLIMCFRRREGTARWNAEWHLAWGEHDLDRTVLDPRIHTTHYKLRPDCPLQIRTITIISLYSFWWDGKMDRSSSLWLHLNSRLQRTNRIRFYMFLLTQSDLQIKQPAGLWSFPEKHLNRILVFKQVKGKLKVGYL